MGAEVTVVEMLDRVVPVEDADVSAFLEKSLTKQGMTIRTGAALEELKVARQAASRPRSRARTARSRPASTATSSSPSASSPNTENIGLEKAGAKLDRGFIQIDPYGRTDAKGLWAIGDCTPGPVAGAQGEPRGRHRRRGDRAGARQQGGPPAPARPQRDPRLHLLPPAGRQRRADRGQGQGGGLHGQGRHVPVHRQRQGDRARRARGLHQDRVRRQDRRAARRAHDRRRSDRADPGLHRRQGARDHRGRADAAPSSRTRR